MKIQKHLSTNVFITLVLLLLIPATESATAQKEKVVLRYSYPSGKTVEYLSVSKVNQEMEINGQTMLVNVISTLGCGIISKGNQGSNLVLDVTIDTLAQTTDTQGIFSGGTLKDAIGKTFTMKLSPTGKESDLGAAESVIIRHDDGTITTAGQSFSNFFPDLPEKSIKPGAQWPSSDTLNSKSSNVSQVIMVNSNNKFEGYEMIRGINCVKISYSLTGTLVLKTRSQGMDLKIQGPVSGTGVLYFAADRGYYLKHEVTTVMTGNLEIVTPESMTFPVRLTINSNTEVKP